MIFQQFFSDFTHIYHTINTIHNKNETKTFAFH